MDWRKTLSARAPHHLLTPYALVAEDALGPVAPHAPSFSLYFLALLDVLTSHFALLATARSTAPPAKAAYTRS